jgi:hypothetical protein
MSDGSDGGGKDGQRFLFGVVVHPATKDSRVAGGQIEKARKLLDEHLARGASRFHIDVELRGEKWQPGTVLGLDWRRSGATAGHALWTWKGRVAAASLVLSGSDGDDRAAIDALAGELSEMDRAAPAQNKLSERLLPADLLKRVRLAPRPTVVLSFDQDAATASTTSPPAESSSTAEAETPIREIGLGLGHAMFTRVRARPRPPLAAAPPSGTGGRPGANPAGAPPKPPAVEIRVTEHPLGPRGQPGVSADQVRKAVAWLRPRLAKSPWRQHVDIDIEPGHRSLELEWWRSGSTSGYARFASQGRPVAVAVVLSGDDAEDCTTLEEFSTSAASTLPPIGSAAESLATRPRGADSGGSGGSQAIDVPPAMIKRLRELDRPLVGIVFAEGAAAAVPDPDVRQAVREFSVALAECVVVQTRAVKPAPPLGSAMRQDFPPRFCQLSIINGVVRRRGWVDSATLRSAINMRHAVAAFSDRLEESPHQFEERIVLHLGAKPDAQQAYRHHVSWRAAGAGAAAAADAAGPVSAGIADLTDERQVPHTLLLLGGKSRDEDEAVVRAFEAAVPHFVRGLFAVALHEVRTGPRPLLVEIVGAEPDRVDPTAGGTATALAAALFRRAGVF